MKLILALAMLASISSASLAGSMFDNQQRCTTNCQTDWNGNSTCVTSCW